MKICLISYEYPPETNLGGIATYTCNMARALVRKGHEVHVIAATEKADFDTQDEGVLVHRVRRPSLPLRESRHLAGAWRVASCVRNLGIPFDIVHASEYRGEAFWLTFSRKFPVVTRLATPYRMVARLQSASAAEQRWTLDWIEKTQTLRSDGIFSSTHALADEVCKMWKLDRKRVSVIPNSVDISRVVSLGDGLPGQAISGPFIIYFGRLEKRKGVDVLARALPAVLGHRPEMKAVFVGKDMGCDGKSMADTIRELAGSAAGRIVIQEGMGQESLFPLVRQAEAVVLPSLWEAFGFVSIEAMALGKVVIATSGSGFAEIIQDGETGYLVPPGDPAPLAAVLNNCLDNAHERQRIGTNAEKAAREFEVDRIADRVLAFYADVRERWLKAAPRHAVKAVN